MLAGSQRPYQAVSEQHSRRCDSTTATVLLADGVVRSSRASEHMDALWAKRTLWSHNGGMTAATVARGRSRGSRPSYAYQRGEPPSRLVWRKYISSIVFYRTFGPQCVHMFAGSWRPYQAVSEQHSRRCGVTTAGRPLPRWAAVAQGGVALRMHISLARDGRNMSSASSTSSRCGVTTAGRPLPRWAAVAQEGVALRMHLSLARDGRNIPSASSTSHRCGVTTVERPLPRWAAVAQGRVALRMHTSEGGATLSPCLAQIQF